MSRKGWLFTSEGMCWANGHWQTYQAAPAIKTWDGDGGLRPLDCFFAPYYGIFVNGQFEKYTDVSNLTWQPTADPNLEYAKIQVDVRPYIPRITDQYYDWDASQGQQTPLQWIAGQNGCVIRRWDPDGMFYTDVETIPAGTDFSTAQFDLIKPTFDYYIFRGLFSNIGYSYNTATALAPFTDGKITYDFLAQKISGAQGVNSMHGLHGLFGEEPKGSAYQYTTSALMKQMFLDDSKKFGNPVSGTGTKAITGGAPPTSPTTQVSWSGVQYPAIWHTGCVNSDFIPMNVSNLPGFKNAGSTLFFRTDNGTSQYAYAQAFVLKKLEKVRGTIVG